jgi:hypothetical protein
MAQRIYRDTPQEVRKKQSDSMKAFHANRTIDDKRATAEKQSMSMKRYWAGISYQNNLDRENEE